MVDFDDDGISKVGCVLILKAKGSNEGELTIEELEQIDDQMLEVGTSRTGQRVGVTTTKIDKGVEVEYAYQESIHHKSIGNIVDRLEAFTPLEDPFVMVDVSRAEFKEEGN